MVNDVLKQTEMRNESVLQVFNFFFNFLILF
jgi:hypothetical protein